MMSSLSVLILVSLYENMVICWYSCELFRQAQLGAVVIIQFIFNIAFFSKIDGKKFFLSPSTLDRICFSFQNNETIRSASSNSRNRSHDLLERVWGRFFYFSFMLILTESLKNYSKLQKNHKIKNPILLDFTWVDIRIEYIIWYILV